MKLCIHFVLATIVLAISSSTVSAQDPPEVPTRWGMSLGLNYNMSGVGYGYWVLDPLRPNGQFIERVINDGSGIGLYGGLSFQTAISKSLHFGTRLSYDNRSFSAKDDQSYRSSASTFFNDSYEFHTSFITIEPHLKLYLGNAFHLTGGLGFGLALNQTFDYAPEDGAAQIGLEVGRADSIKHSLTGSFFGGVGYDIYLSSARSKQQWILTPFLETTYMVSQRGVDLADQGSFDDALSTISIRAGISLAFGSAKGVPDDVPTSTRFFRVTPPADGSFTKRVEQTDFPLRPFVFFARSNPQIPSRYNAIAPADVPSFGPTTGLTANNLNEAKERPDVQNEVYYNILNILGYRLSNTSGSSMELYSSDPDGTDPLPNAESVKNYLVNVWGVRPEQLTVSVGVADPQSGTPRTPAADRPKAEEENRRVQFRSFNPESIGRRVPVIMRRSAETSNQVYLELLTNENIDSWQATISGKGHKRTFGPFSSRAEYLDPTGLLAIDQPSSVFTVEVTARTADGRTLTDQEDFTLTRTRRDGISKRFRLNFEYAEEDPVTRSEEYILNTIVPDIPDGALIYIYGHTDNLGTSTKNLEFSKARATQVRQIIESAIGSRGIKNVTIVDKGTGEVNPPMLNSLPEGRMYNRTVIIDILH